MSSRWISLTPSAGGLHGVAFGLNIQPAGQGGGLRAGRVAVAPDDLLEQLAALLQPFAGEDLGDGRAGGPDGRAAVQHVAGGRRARLLGLTEGEVHSAISSPAVCPSE